MTNEIFNNAMSFSRTSYLEQLKYALLPYRQTLLTWAVTDERWFIILVFLSALQLCTAVSVVTNQLYRRTVVDNRRPRRRAICLWATLSTILDRTRRRVLPPEASAVITTRRLALRCLSPQLQYAPLSSIKIANPRRLTD